MSTREELARVIDHTNLHPGATAADLHTLVEEANEHGFAAVCVYPADVPRVVDEAEVDVCTVVGFPHGKSPTQVTAEEARNAVEAGADEVDMVIDQTALKHEETEHVVDGITAVRDAVPGATLKVIVETCNLTEEETIEACQTAVEGGADFVKTSTGFGAYGATVEDVALMAEALADTDQDVGIKAAGGIKTAEEALRLWEASGRIMEPEQFRIGASSSLTILEGIR